MYQNEHANDYAYQKSWSRTLGKVFAENVLRGRNVGPSSPGSLIRVLDFGCGPAYASSYFVKHCGQPVEVWLEDLSADQLAIGEKHMLAVAGKGTPIHKLLDSAFLEADRVNSAFLDWLPRGNVLDASFVTLVCEYLSRNAIVALLVTLLQHTADDGVVFVADWAKHAEYRGKEADGVKHLSGICKATWLGILADVVRAVEAEDEATNGDVSLTAFEFSASASRSSGDSSPAALRIGVHNEAPSPEAVSIQQLAQGQPRHHRIVASTDTAIGRRKARVRVEVTISDLSVACCAGRDSLEAASSRSRTGSTLSSSSDGSSSAASSSSEGFSIASSRSAPSAATSESPLADTLFVGQPNGTPANGAGASYGSPSSDGADAGQGHCHVRSASAALKSEGASSRQIHTILLKKTMTPL